MSRRPSLRQSRPVTVALQHGCRSLEDGACQTNGACEWRRGRCSVRNAVTAMDHGRHYTTNKAGETNCRRVFPGKVGGKRIDLWSCGASKKDICARSGWVPMARAGPPGSICRQLKSLPGQCCDGQSMCDAGHPGSRYYSRDPGGMNCEDMGSGVCCTPRCPVCYENPVAPGGPGWADLPCARPGTINHRLCGYCIADPRVRNCPACFSDFRREDDVVANLLGGLRF